MEKQVIVSPAELDADDFSHPNNVTVLRSCTAQDGKNPRLNPCCKMSIQIGQNHSMVYELNLFSGGAKIINSPITNIIIEIPRNFNSPIGGIPWVSINILNIGPLIGRKNNTTKTPIFCLRPMNIRVGTRFSNHSVHRIDLGMTCAR